MNKKETNKMNFRNDIESKVKLRCSTYITPQKPLRKLNISWNLRYLVTMFFYYFYKKQSSY